MTLDPARVFATLDGHGVGYLNDVPGAGDDDLRARAVEPTLQASSSASSDSTTSSA